MNVSEDQKRWLIVGIAFNNLVPQIRPFVEHSLKAEYHKLIHSNSIHVQTAAGGLLKKHPKPLKYENINGNNNHKLASGKFDFSRFDYRITSHVDFAKLYVQPFMAKFNAFDGACDGSAVLLLLGEVPAFSSAMQLSAKAVRDRVRNEWAHCNLTDWDAAKFKNCFHEMQTLVRSLRLSPVDEAKLLGELGDWETKGTKFCGNSPVDSSLLSLVHNEVSQLGSNLDDFVCKYKEEKDILETTFSEVKESLDQLLKLPQKVDSIENEVRTLKQQVADLSSDKSEESTKPPKFVGALDRNEYFTGRRSEMENLEKAFGVINTTPAVHAVAEEKSNVLGICGLGGCGKSSLAFEYAWRNIECYPGGVLVVNGESDEMLRKSLQRIHGEFVAAESVRDWSNQQNETAETFERVLSETLSWLGNLRDRWLLLVDNMDQKELSPCARRILLGQWKTKCSGHILVTSRRRPEALCEILDLASENCFELNPWSLDESVEFLKKRTELPPSSYQDQGVEELVEELGGLPLALEQAAAYIKALKCSIQSYLQQYHLQKCTLLNVESAKPRAEIYTEARLAVETTWLLNFSYISNGEKDQGLGKAAAFFMKIAAYLSPDEIPIEILNVGAPEIEHGDLKKRLEMPLGATQIVELLVKFSLFKRKSNDSLSIHRLVQENLRDRCNSEGETNQVLASAIRMMHQTFLNCVGGTDFFRDFYNRLASLPRKQETNSLDFEGAIHLAYASMSVPLESRRWQKLSENGFHLVVHLLNDLPLKPSFFCEESARVFCEAAFHCYSLGVESQGHRLQQCVIEIVCAIKEPIRYYKDDGLLRISRILRPFMDSAIFEMRLLHSESAKETINDETGVPGEGTAQFQISEVIKMIEPKAKDAFSRGDFQTSADLYSDIVKRSNFNLFVELYQTQSRTLFLLGRFFVAAVLRI
ncbi:hypothetical protein OS493_004552 [Desmophyllum pertusum]|uniref:DUF7779 domain-containing protein n=1 Tax=Desmophyllum pertusum TaxID=174260 RepID=A0A9W9ZGC6_9CNID|nr:hypothetical protein OS493_004552 [Desmophyllum pertusum]